jgi:K+-transporting ATPase KdpF subunit
MRLDRAKRKTCVVVPLEMAPRGSFPRHAPCSVECAMSLEYWVGSLLALAITGYLIYALLKPEHF